MCRGKLNYAGEVSKVALHRYEMDFNCGPRGNGILQCRQSRCVTSISGYGIVDTGASGINAKDESPQAQSN